MHSGMYLELNVYTKSRKRESDEERLLTI